MSEIFGLTLKMSNLGLKSSQIFIHIVLRLKSNHVSRCRSHRRRHSHHLHSLLMPVRLSRVVGKTPLEGSCWRTILAHRRHWAGRLSMAWRKSISRRRAISWSRHGRSYGRVRATRSGRGQMLDENTSYQTERIIGGTNYLGHWPENLAIRSCPRWGPPRVAVGPRRHTARSFNKQILKLYS